VGFYEPVQRRDVRSIDVVLDRPALLKIDGELRAGIREVHSRVHPAAVTFRVPAPHA
jgi:diacylglycerol kinase family enzyme